MLTSPHQKIQKVVLALAVTEGASRIGLYITHNCALYGVALFAFLPGEHEMSEGVDGPLKGNTGGET